MMQAVALSGMMASNGKPGARMATESEPVTVTAKMQNCGRVKRVQGHGH